MLWVVFYYQFCICLGRYFYSSAGQTAQRVIQSLSQSVSQQQQQQQQKQQKRPCTGKPARRACRNPRTPHSPSPSPPFLYPPNMSLYRSHFHFHSGSHSPSPAIPFSCAGCKSSTIALIYNFCLAMQNTWAALGWLSEMGAAVGSLNGGRGIVGLRRRMCLA